MIRKSSFVLVFLLAASFSSNILVDQLFWDSDSAYDYAGRILSHPNVPKLLSSSELGLEGVARKKYDSLKKDSDALRLSVSRVKLLAGAVQRDSLEMKKNLPFLVNVVLSFFGKGFKSELASLVESENELRRHHADFLKNDLKRLVESIDNSESLSTFSGRVALSNKVTYSDIRIRAKDMPEINTGMPFVAEVIPSEPACIVKTQKGEIQIPRYLSELYFPDITSGCIPLKFYTKNQMKSFVVMWGPSWGVFEKRLQLLSDLNDYLRVVSGFVASTEKDARLKLDSAFLLSRQAESIEALVLNSSVKLALQTLGKSDLVARDVASPNINETYSKMYDEMTLAERSNNLGKKFTHYENVISGYARLNALVTSSWPALEKQVATMESLCITYGGSCEYGGDFADRLRQTSRTFLELRAKYLEGRGESPANIYATLLEDELNSLYNTVSLIEPFIDATKLIKYRDALLGFEKKLKFQKTLTDKNPQILQTLLSDVVNFHQDVESDFFKEFRDDALKIKSELLSLSKILSAHGELVLIEDKTISAFSNPVQNIVYYLSRGQLLENLELKYSRLLADFSSNVPSRVLCSPDFPILGEKFKVRCVVLINNSWGVDLETANSVLNLPYPPLSLNSKNFVGDMAQLKSISFSDGNTRMNFKNLGALAFFNLTYESRLAPAALVCGYVTKGVIADFECSFFSNCDFPEASVPLIHPFAGREMKSTTEYSYNGTHIFVKIPCGKKFDAVFTGPSVDMISEGGSLLVTSLINATNDFVVNVPLDSTSNASIGLILTPFEKKKFDLDAKVSPTTLDEKTKETSPNQYELLGYTSYETAAHSLFAGETFYNEFGCVEENIVSTISKSYKFPKLTCIRLTGLEKVKEFYDAGNYEQAVKEFLGIRKSAGLEAFIAKSARYERQASDLIEQANSLNPVMSRFVRPYLLKSKLAYDNGDYISSMYYSQYALLKSTIHLGIDFRVLIALAILAYGIYSSRKKEEPLLIDA